MLGRREGLEGDVEERRRDRQPPDEEDAETEDTVIDAVLAEAADGEETPVRQEQDGVDELHQMPAAPEQEFARDHESPGPGQEISGDGEGDQCEDEDKAADRHGERKRRPGRPPRRQVDEEAHDGREHAERQQDEAEIVSRMTDERDVVRQFRRGRIEEGRREQAGEGNERHALAESAERRGARPLARQVERRRRRQEGEHAEEPDDQRKDDVDDEALVEEADRPQRRLVHARGSRQREQQRKDAGDRQRADRKPGPAGELAPQRARGACGVEADGGGWIARPGSCDVQLALSG